MADQPEAQPVADAKPKRSQRDQNRLIGAAVAAALLIAFALVNTEKVKVDWIVTSKHSPLIVVIVVSAAIGALGDRFMVIRARRKKS
ncbi:MAG TPA: LapA family protein [Solirubrobacteraceae bacterium]|nr:LapA family protein [Solirubrobacteraceae bacterium]